MVLCKFVLSKNSAMYYSLKDIERIVDECNELYHINREPANLYEPLEYMMSIGGKRIRPKLCLLTYAMLRDCRIEEPVLMPAMALEIYHEFTLMHDDIMDRSDMRRGCPTVCKKWNENVAILSGDAMLILAFRYLYHVPKPILRDVLDLFSFTAMQVCEGQQYDMDFERRTVITMEEYLEMIRLKTAVLLGCATKMGALLAGADDKVCHKLSQFGCHLGMAFQIADDYLDTFGDEKVFGKKIGGDIVNNKKTWLLVECFRRASADQQKRLESLLQMGEAQRAEKIAAVRALYEELGIREAAENEIRTWHRKALEVLDSAGIQEDRDVFLKMFAERLLRREK